MYKFKMMHIARSYWYLIITLRAVF